MQRPVVAADRVESDRPYDALLVVSFGGPEGQEDVLPFLENVLRGKNVPRERMLEVAEHYRQFGGVSPINEQNRQLIAAVRADFAAHGIALPIYWGNRNWHPLLPAALRQMQADGIQRALGFFTSVFSSYSGCRQYRENIAAAQEEVGASAPRVDKLRMPFNHPRFIASMADRTRQAIASLPAAARPAAVVLFTAHSIPLAMAANCKYESQLRESARLVADACGVSDWEVVYQSRSGPPQQPWLEPDVCDRIDQLSAERPGLAVVLVPIGFVSDHMEVIYDLDTEARQLCEELGIPFARAGTAGTHPEFVTMIRELVVERMTQGAERPACGDVGPSHDVCPADCCLYAPQRPVR